MGISPNLNTNDFTERGVEMKNLRELGLFFVIILMMGGCVSTKAFVPTQPQVIINQSSQTQKPVLSHDELVANELVRLEKIINWEDPKTKLILNRRFKKSTKGMSFTKATHYERDRKRQNFLRCEFPNYIAVKHNNRPRNVRCSISGGNFVASKGIYGTYSDYSAMDAPVATSRNDGQINVKITNNNVGGRGTGGCPYAPHSLPYFSHCVHHHDTHGRVIQGHH